MTNTLFSGERIRLIRVTDEHIPPFAGWLTDFGVQRFVNPGAVMPMTTCIAPYPIITGD